MLTRDILRGLKGASMDAVKRPLATMVFIGCVVGPCLLLAAGGRDRNGLPWYIWTGISLLLLLVIGGGFLLFNRRDRVGDLSISPKQPKEPGA